MIENFEQTADFIKPDLVDEIGEFKRTADVFNIEDSALLFLAEEGCLAVLSEDIWKSLQNSDSFPIEKGDWSQVEKCSVMQEKPRDWENLKSLLEAGQKINAPIVLKRGDEYYLVSGNTRLMVSRALGIVPKIWLFEVFNNEAD